MQEALITAITGCRRPSWHGVSEARTKRSPLRKPVFESLHGLSIQLSELQNHYAQSGDAEAAESVRQMGQQLGMRMQAGGTNFVNKLAGMGVEKRFLDPAKSAGRIAEMQQRRDEIMELANYVELRLSNSNDTEAILYTARLKHESEEAAQFGGSAGSATKFCNINGLITLDGNGNYKIDVYLQPSHWSINGGIERSSTNTGTLFLDLNHWEQATPVRLTINSPIDNNGGPVTLLGDSAGILQLDVAGHDIGDFRVNGAYTETYQSILKLGISDTLASTKNLTLTKGTFDLAGYNQTVNALSGAASASLITNTGSADSKLTVGNGGGNATFSGVIQDGATHKLGLEKTGIGTQTLRLLQRPRRWSLQRRPCG